MLKWAHAHVLGAAGLHWGILRKLKCVYGMLFMAESLSLIWRDAKGLTRLSMMTAFQYKQLQMSAPCFHIPATLSLPNHVAEHACAQGFVHRFITHFTLLSKLPGTLRSGHACILISACWSWSSRGRPTAGALCEGAQTARAKGLPHHVVLFCQQWACIFISACWSWGP